jgi:hypothetical protein
MDKGKIVKDLNTHRRHNGIVNLIIEKITGHETHHRSQSFSPERQDISHGFEKFSGFGRNGNVGYNFV